MEEIRLRAYHKTKMEKLIERKRKKFLETEARSIERTKYDPERVERGKRIMEKVLGEKEEEVEFRLQVRVGIVDMANLSIGLENARETAALKNLTTLTQAAFKLAVRYLMDKEEEITDVDEALQVLEHMRIIDIDSTSLSGGALRRNRIRNSRGEMERDMRDYHEKHPSDYPIKGITKKGITQEEIDNFNPETYLQEISKIPSDPVQEAHARQMADKLKREEIERRKQSLKEELEKSQSNPQGLFPSPRTDLKEGEADVTFNE